MSTHFHSVASPEVAGSGTKTRTPESTLSLTVLYNKRPKALLVFRYRNITNLQTYNFLAHQGLCRKHQINKLVRPTVVIWVQYVQP